MDSTPEVIVDEFESVQEKPADAGEHYSNGLSVDDGTSADLSHANEDYNDQVKTASELVELHSGMEENSCQIGTTETETTDELGEVVEEFGHGECEERLNEVGGTVDAVEKALNEDLQSRICTLDVRQEDEFQRAENDENPPEQVEQPVTQDVTDEATDKGSDIVEMTHGSVCREENKDETVHPESNFEEDKNEEVPQEPLNELSTSDKETRDHLEDNSETISAQPGDKDQIEAEAIQVGSAAEISESSNPEYGTNADLSSPAATEAASSSFNSIIHESEAAQETSRPEVADIRPEVADIRKDESSDTKSTPVSSVESESVEIGHDNVPEKNNVTPVTPEPYSQPSPQPVPVNCQPVEKIAIPEIAKTVRNMFESGQIPDRHEIKKITPELEIPSEFGVFENKPNETREGVVQSSSSVSQEPEVQKGTTKSLLNQWKQKGEEKFCADKKPINISEAEGKVLESEPVIREDVAREDQVENITIARGQTQILKEQWATKKDFQKESKPVRLVENENEEPMIAENTPIKRTDVSREEDSTEEIWLKKGYAKDLAGFWSQPKNENGAGREKSPIELPKGTEPSIVENVPQKLDGVVRADDPAESPVSIEKGRAKMMANMWQTKKDETTKQPFKLEMDINQDEVGVYENKPVEREGVVKSGATQDEVMGTRGVIKSMTGKFLQKDDEPRKPKEAIVIDFDQGPSVHENEPTLAAPDVIKSESSPVVELPVKQGITKNLVQQWKNQEIEKTKQPESKLFVDPNLVLEAAKAQESGIFENQPAVRDDVIREVDNEPEMIPVKKTRNTREMWNKMGQEDDSHKNKLPELVRFTPPREMTPPKVNEETFKSYQKLTLSPSNDLSSSSPSPSTTSPGAYIPHGSPYQSNGSDANHHEKITSSTVLQLKSS